MKYKICLLIIAAISVLHFSSISQNTDNVFSFKPFVGLNACQIHGDNASGYHQPGINGGIIVNSYLNKKTSLDIGFMFSQKGARKNQNVDKGDYDFFSITLNYIELPVLLNYKVNNPYFITVGPSIAYLAGYKEYYNGINWSGVYPFNKFEYNVNFGLGRKIKNNWLVEVRTTNSFMPIRNYGTIANHVFFPNPLARFFNKGLYNNILSAFIIYHIKIKKKSETISQ